MIDVVVQDLFSNQFHAAPASLGGEIERPQDGGLEAIDVVRIDQERLLQLVGSAGELTQDQRAVVLGTGGDIFLGHQVHAVAQRRDQHDVRREIERHHFLNRVAVGQVADGGVLDGVVGAIDMANGAFDFFTQKPVLLHAFTAGARYLYQGGILHLDAALPQEFLEGLQAVADALGVVQAVHAKKDGLRIAQVLADLLGPLDDVRPPGQLPDLVNIDGNREGLRPGNVGDLAVRALYMHLLLLDAGAQEAAGRAHEV